MARSKAECGILAWLIAALGMMIVRPALVVAAASPTVMAVTLNAGEQYIIENVSTTDTAAVKVVSNPQAMVVHNETPGKIVVLGAQEGEWKIEVKTSAGEPVTYDVTVKSAANPLAISSPSAAPPPIVGSGRTTGEAAPVVVSKMDTPPDSSAPTSPDSSSSASGASSDGSPATYTPPAATTASSGPAPASPGEGTGTAYAGERPTFVHRDDDTVRYKAAPPAPSMPAINAQGNGPNGTFFTNPTVAETGADYFSPSVNAGKHYLPEDSVTVMTGSSRIIDFTAKIRRVSVADTGVADIQVVNPYQINLIGHKPGFTTLAVWNTRGQYEERQVRIDPSGKQQVLLNCLVAELNKSNIENQGMNLSAAFPNYGLSLFGLPGNVATPYSAQTSTGGGGASNNSLAPAGSLNGLILSNNITYGLAGANSQVNTQGLFQYLENHSLAKILAEPHLLANSGEEAKFLSGGEIPIVLAQALNTSIVFKQFGTSVEFVPTVIGRNDVELLVKPEVSEPNFALGVNLFGFTVPAFITRRAETMVRLKDNQTLLIAGLILHEKKTQVDKVPYLGDIPFISGLFKHTNYTNQETDLVMSVTPNIVRPLPDGAPIYNPGIAPELTREQIETHRLSQPDVSRPRF
jgi:Flp pilus assembly secretin CpaC